MVDFSNFCYIHLMVPELVLRTKFEDVLKGYRPSQHACRVLADMPLVLLVGVSASGRNTIVAKLVASGRYNFVVSDTTRKPRINNGVAEREGVEYYFRTEEQVFYDLKMGEYLEAAIIHDQQVSGISIREIERIKYQERIPVADVQTDGVESILSVKPDVHCIFILPPSYSEWMRRLDSRGVMSETEKKRRLKSALDEIRYIQNGDYLVIVNEDLEKSVRQVRGIVEKGERLPYHHSKAERVVKELQAAIQKDLKHY